MKKSALCFAISSALLSAAFTAQAASVKVLDKTLSPAANFLAYTEFELSGEPLAESLGLDLDVLDPNQVDQPTAFDYAAGIESYEYSEEAMYALNYQSTMGPHLVNGPINQARGGSLADLGKRFISLAGAVGFPSEEIPLNMYPISVPYVSGSPEFAGKVDTTKVNGEELEVLSATGKAAVHNTVIPAYFRDYKTLAWDNASFDKALNPGAIGSIFLKEVMWSQDFLGGMHVTTTDEEVEATSSTMDQDGKHSLGVSAADGFNGMILTEMSIDKLLILQQQLGFDGKNLGVKFGPDYDASKNPIWFAHKVAVKETQKNNVNNIGKLAVTDGSSSLRDTWMLLWPVSEFYAFTDQRTANTAQNPAFKAVFDGKPFAAAPKQNIDGKTNNNVVADDAFSLASNIANLSFQNLANLHFNKKAGTFVTKYDGKQNAQVETFDAAYSIVALSIYQRSQDALPVGYAAADGGDVDLATPQGKQALGLIKAQADYIVNTLVAKNGLVYDGATVGKSVDKNQSLDAQFAAIRGLVSAYLATQDNTYKQAARSIFLAVEKNMFDAELGTWAQTPGKATIHTPLTAAAISGGLRETILHLANEEGEHVPALELQHLTERYTAWFKKVVNGGQQLSEWVGDSGENLLKNSSTTDSDNDGVQQVTAAGGKYGTAQTMAAKVSVSAN
ncbi:hypothetical protein [Moritella viscosa]|uniref:Lipoprotein n=1 Tax=Moritella viscosa TaxID=80854 RepID=A0A1L0ET67_9GAMM|nr:hypothetical protein [Moritella viscosa]SGZ10708.1 Putative uncharacterized protein [Moritella viscosa]SHO11928.1 Putative uncharacterized protein [Moritella viscosa]SHO11929.1 Putative uncharacterized protein [Moritella viscosa]SHO16371.1 Putative uncharacterized protein [Moritella viscosa]SHO18214.1 Putative uncharacterized protein [Moritella viscosa]